MNEWTVETHSPEETRKLAAGLGALLEPGDVVLLEGDLGAGKTHFAQGVAQGLLVAEEVTSPTFTLIAEYEGKHPFVHMDLYRLYNDPSLPNAALSAESLAQIGFEDYLGGDEILLIEWPKGVMTQIDDYLSVTFFYTDSNCDTSREIRVRAVGQRASERLEKWVELWA